MRAFPDCKPFVLYLSSLVLGACNQTSHQPLLLVGETMGTTYTVKIMNAETTLNPESLQRNIDQLLEDINSIMSTYDPDSELSKLNRNPSRDCISLSEQLSEVIQQALKTSQLTQGDFDITIGPLVKLWGFGPEAIPTQIPGNNEIQAAQNIIGHDKLTLAEDGGCLNKEQPDMYIDLSAIAKGYAVDEIAKLLQASNIEDYMIEIGGEIKANGLNVNNIPWQIGIEKPVEGQRSVQTIISLQDTGLATSGDYRNYFEHDGVRYSHLIDADSGKPISHNLVSVTVLHQSTMIADALATAFMVMGYEQANQLATNENIAVYFILRQDDEFIEAASDLFTTNTKH